jgi:hypothetical protein
MIVSGNGTELASMGILRWSDERRVKWLHSSMLVELAGSGSFSGAGMMAQNLKVDSSGSGSVLASASRETVVSISGSGHVKVRGGSACRSEVAGGGRLDCR